MKKRYKDAFKPRSIRVSEDTWQRFDGLKRRGKSWDYFLNELLDAINRIKNL